MPTQPVPNELVIEHNRELESLKSQLKNLGLLDDGKRGKLIPDAADGRTLVATVQVWGDTYRIHADSTFEAIRELLKNAERFGMGRCDGPKNGKKLGYGFGRSSQRQSIPNLQFFLAEH